MDAFGGNFETRVGTQIVASGHNTRLVYWGHAAARLFAGHAEYSQWVAYIEFVNDVPENDTVAIPEFTANDGLEYYTALETSPDRDYLRVPVLLPSLLEVASGYTEFFTPPLSGNQLRLMATTTGNVGVHGKPFTDNSVLVGFCFALTPDFNDPSVDIPFGRAYYSTMQQFRKPVGLDVTVTYTPFFGLV